MTLGDGANDGLTGEGDNVQTTVENITGGQAPDTLTGDDDRNVLTGNRGNDTLSGGIGADDLLGNAGADRLLGGDNADLLSGIDGGDVMVGGPGVDRFFGAADADQIDARDGEVNQISCGEEVTNGRDFDLLTSDLRDAVPADCESIDQMATDDGPPGRAMGRRLRVRRGGTAIVRVRCPRRARVACRGVLTLRHPRSDRVLGRGRYGVRLGRRAAVTVSIRRRLPRRVFAQMEEQGVSEKGPRLSRRLLRVRR